MSSEDTKSRILDAALKLFNEKGTIESTTNHIAAEIGISPGNLYYHFRNREEIVRALFERMVKIADPVWQGEETEKIQSDFVFKRITGMVELMIFFFQKYTFFSRDFHFIMRKDPDLAKSFRTMIEERLHLARAVFAEMAKMGYMHEIPEREMDIYFHNMWIVSENWQPYATFIGKDKGEVTAYLGVIQTMFTLRPLLTKKGANMLEKILNPYYEEIEKAGLI